MLMLEKTQGAKKFELQSSSTKKEFDFFLSFFLNMCVENKLKV